MPWNESQLKRALLIERHGTPQEPVYRLNPYMRVTTLDGDTYLEPLPAGEVSLAHLGLTFTTIEFIDPPSSGQYGGGDTFMTRDSNNMALRLTE